MQTIQSQNAPDPLGPYSQATVHNNTVYVSMQIPVKGNKQHQPDLPIADQLRQVLENVGAIIKDAGSSLENCLQVTIYATDLSAGVEINEVYEEFFATDSKPARTMVEVAALPLDYQIAVSAIAWIK